MNMLGEKICSPAKFNYYIVPAAQTCKPSNGPGRWSMKWSKSGKSVTYFGHGPDAQFFRPKLGQSTKFFLKALRAGLTNPRDILDSFTVTLAVGVVIASGAAKPIELIFKFIATLSIMSIVCCSSIFGECVVLGTVPFRIVRHGLWPMTAAPKFYFGRCLCDPWHCQISENLNFGQACSGLDFIDFGQIFFYYVVTAGQGQSDPWQHMNFGAVRGVRDPWLLNNSKWYSISSKFQGVANE